MLIVGGHKLVFTGSISWKWAKHDRQCRIGVIAVVIPVAMEVESLVSVAGELKINGDEKFAIHAVTICSYEVVDAALRLGLHCTEATKNQEKDGINDVFHA